MVLAIARDIEDLLQLGVSTVGVLCKTTIEAKTLHDALVKEGVEGLGLIDATEDRPSPILVAPAYLARGLEFDAAIVANAGKANYPDSVLHTRVLYLAVSRAAHRLHIHWWGALATALEPSRGSVAREILQGLARRIKPRI